MTKFVILAAALLAVTAVSGGPVRADEPAVHSIVIKDHKFDPEVVTIPAGTRVRLQVKNMDATPEEFESKQFKVEKVIAGNSEAAILVGPLKAGTYTFFGDFHENTAQGKLVVQ
jgi:plastocyanin